MPDTSYLTGHLLIAMPAMQDPNFHRTVTYICEHSDQGALGIIINRPLDLDLGSVFEQLSLNPSDPSLAQQPVLQGPRRRRVRRCRGGRCGHASSVSNSCITIS